MFNFDQVIDRRASDSGKWNSYDEDVLPMWVADMDFASPEPIVRALHERVEHGVYGYGYDLPALRAVLVERMEQRHGWRIQPDDILFLPGLVCGLNITARAIGQRGDGVLVNPPVYPPFLSAPVNQWRTVQYAQQQVETQGRLLRYSVDVDALEAAILPSTRLFILCNPHNPTGRVFTRNELSEMAEMCQRHNLVICSDEIHCDLLLDGAQHIPIASLDPEIAARTITLIAPSKTFNVPGLGCSFAIVQNPALRKQMMQAAAGIVPHVNFMGMAAALAAYSHCDDWLVELRAYLTANRNRVVEYVTNCLPGVKTTVPEATYLAWLDFREAGVKENPYRFFLREARVALNDSTAFGPGSEGFARLNFGCPASTLLEGLERIRAALPSLN